MNVDWSWIEAYDCAGLSTEWSDKNAFLHDYPIPKNHPFIWIDPRRRYADLQVDFIFANVNLTDGASEAVGRIVDTYLERTTRLNKPNTPPSIVGAPGFKTYCGCQDFRKDVASELGQELAEIVFDGGNWEHILNQTPRGQPWKQTRGGN